jgi:hypothetical protein
MIGTGTRGVVYGMSEAEGAQTEFPNFAPDDGDTGAEHGISEGHSGAPASLESRHHGQRVHAGSPRKCEADGGFRVLHAHGKRKFAESFCEFATKCYQTERGRTCEGNNILDRL